MCARRRPLLPLLPQSPPRLPSVESVDFLVLGSGIAGLSYALAVAEHGRVAVVTKGPADEGCTRYAQGGICAVLDPLDSVEAHVRDTLRAGAWLNDPGAVDAVCREGPALVLELARLGADFTRAEGGPRGAAPSGLHLTREGGHSARRIVHAADATGAEIERALLAQARAHPNIELHEHYVGIDLVTGDVGGERVCLGADALDVARAARALPVPGHDAGHGRRGAALPGDDQPVRGHRRRHGHGGPRGRAPVRPRVCPVPPHSTCGQGR